MNRQFGRLLGIGIIMLGATFGSTAMASEAKRLSETRSDVIYHNRCSVCHGDRGDGQSKARNSLNPPPRDLTQVTELPLDYLIAVIAHGKPGTAMAGYGNRLNAEQIEGLAVYIQDEILNRAAVIAAGGITGISGTSAYGELPASMLERLPGAAAAHVAAGRAAPSAAPVPPIAAPLPVRKPVSNDEVADMSLAFPSDLQGDMLKGRDFYVANCAECHGVAGDGQGPRAYFIRPVPRDFTDERSRATLNRPTLYAATYFGRNATEMPAWSKVISEQEIADVSEYVFQAFIAPERHATAEAK